MKNEVGLFARALVALLAGATVAAQAFTLGDLRGAAVIGRELDVSVRVQGGAGEEVSTDCVGADLYFSDVRQAAPLVTVSVGADTQSVVRIQSASIVDEPVVTVLVRSTCGSSTMRRYVLLADFPQIAPIGLAVPAGSVSTLPQAATPSPGVVNAAPVLVLPPAAEPGVAGADAQAKVPPTPRVPKVKKVPVHQTEPTEPTEPVMRKAAGKPTHPLGKSALKLDPLDILSGRIDSLDSTMVFAPTEDAIKQTQQIASLQADVKTLRDLAAKNDAKLAGLRIQLQQAQEQQLPMLIVYALLVLVLLCIGAVTWLWYKQRQSQKNAQAAWWQDDDKGSPSTILTPQAPMSALKSAFTVKPATQPVPVAAPTPKTAPSELTTQPPAPDVVLHDVDLDIDLDDFMLAETSPVEPQVASAGSSTLVHPVHAISAEVILDIRQQAEFFVSLGQTDRALRILNKQIAESAEPNPLVYLDLLGLYHSLGLKVDFREARDVFGQLFNAQVPDFPAFNLEGKDLEAYPEVLSDLAPRWPGVNALVFLDACIFYDPQVQERPLFDLAAFRDLLMLHVLAEELALGLSSLDTVSGPPVVPVAPVALPSTLPAASFMPIKETPPVPKSLAMPSAEPMPWVEGQVADVSSDSPVASVQAVVKAFANDLALVPVPDAPALHIPSSQPVTTPLPAVLDTDKNKPPVEASPSRMLDLDFSSLLQPTPDAAKPVDDSEPIIKPPVRYATRSRWPVTKKPK